jgi:putative endonuclease
VPGVHDPVYRVPAGRPLALCETGATLGAMRLAERAITWERRLYFALQSHADRRARRAAQRAGSRPQPTHLITGRRGEDEAFFWLRSLGYTVVARRWRSERLRGDLDLVAWDGDTLVIFEIKTLTAAGREEAYRPAEWQVDREKQRMLRRMAAAYRRQMPERWRGQVRTRFDVVSVYLQPNALPVFEHFPRAFSPSE